MLHHINLLANDVPRLLDVLFDEHAHLSVEILFQAVQTGEGHRKTLHVFNALDGERAAREHLGVVLVQELSNVTLALLRLFYGGKMVYYRVFEAAVRENLLCTGQNMSAFVLR